MINLVCLFEKRIEAGNKGQLEWKWNLGHERASPLWQKVTQAVSRALHYWAIRRQEQMLQHFYLNLNILMEGIQKKGRCRDVQVHTGGWGLGSDS